MKPDSTVADEIAEWRKTGIALRSKLEDERKELVARLARVDADLAALPRLSEPAGPGKLDGRGTKAHGHHEKKSVPATVLEVVRTAAAPMSAPEVLEIVTARIPKVDSRNVYSALYRFSKKTKQFATSGSKGSMLYHYVGGPN